MKNRTDSVIPAGEFKATCLHVMDEVSKSRHPITITKRGKPIVKLIPFDEEKPLKLFGKLKGSMTLLTDIIQPIDEQWSANESSGSVA